MKSRIWDCVEFPNMVQEIISNDHWVFSKMADFPIGHSQALSTLQDGMWDNFSILGEFPWLFFIVGILLDNLKWLIYSFQIKTIDFFKVEVFLSTVYRPLQPSTELLITAIDVNYF